jgi:predicted nucleic acid-binding protein
MATGIVNASAWNSALRFLYSAGISAFVPPNDAVMAVWVRSPGCRLIGEGPGYFELLSDLCRHAHIAGPMIHDARIAAICLHHRVTELWTVDRDFSRFSGLRTVNPLT